MAMIAAVVDPVGRNAYWSVSNSAKAGEVSMGYRMSLVINFSSKRDSTGVIDIGLKSLQFTAAAILGTGVIHADFHCVGTLDSNIESRHRYVKGIEMPGAANRRNQVGRPSRPVADCFK